MSSNTAAEIMNQNAHVEDFSVTETESSSFDSVADQEFVQPQTESRNHKNKDKSSCTPLKAIFAAGALLAGAGVVAVVSGACESSESKPSAGGADKESEERDAVPDVKVSDDGNGRSEPKNQDRSEFSNVDSVCTFKGVSFKLNMAELVGQKTQGLTQKNGDSFHSWTLGSGNYILYFRKSLEKHTDQSVCTIYEFKGEKEALLAEAADTHNSIRTKTVFDACIVKDDDKSLSKLLEDIEKFGIVKAHQKREYVQGLRGLKSQFAKRHQQLAQQLRDNKERQKRGNLHKRNHGTQQGTQQACFAWFVKHETKFLCLGWFLVLMLACCVSWFVYTYRTEIVAGWVGLFDAFKSEIDERV